MSSAEREVKAVVTSYVHPDGAPRIALRGDVIEVHPDHVSSFDESEARVPEPKAVAADVLTVEDESEYRPEEPPRSGKGSGLEQWATYGRQIGLDIHDGMSREDIIALVDDK